MVLIHVLYSGINLGFKINSWFTHERRLLKDDNDEETKQGKEFIQEFRRLKY